MRGYYKSVCENPAFYVLANLFFLLVVSLLYDGISKYVVLLVFASSVVQMFLVLSPKLMERMLGVEKMTEKSASYKGRGCQKVAMVMAGVPLVSLHSLLLGTVWFSGCLVVSLGLFKQFFKVAFCRRSLRKAYIEKLAEHSPEVAVYVSGLGNVAYQINQWLPVMERLQRRVVIIIRERSIFEDMQRTKLPVYYARTQRDVESIYSAAESVRVVLYPANTMKNVQSFRHFKLLHYFINHGESDKAVNQSKLLMAYDKLLVGGPLAKRRLEEAGLPIREGQVEFVGRPQAEILLDVVDKDCGKKIETVLYAPTWEGFVEDVNYSSVSSLGLRLLKCLSQDKSYRVLFKPHPYTGRRSKKTAQYLEKMRSICSGNIEFLDAMSPIHEAMNRSDVLIADISSVLNEYLVTKKPIVLCDVKQLSNEGYYKEFPSSKAASLLRNGEGILELLSEISSYDRLEGERDKVREDSLSSFEEGAMKRFSKVIDEAF